MTKFYVSNSIPTIGQSYLILSIEEDESNYHVEKILLVPAFSDLQALITHCSKVLLNDIINGEIDSSKGYLNNAYSKQLEENHFKYVFEFKENAHILHFLNHKSPKELNNIKKVTFNSELKRLIDLHQKIEGSKIDFD